MQYDQLVNKTHPYQEKNNQNRHLLSIKNMRGEEIFIEEKTYRAFLELQDALRKENIEIGLIDAFRTQEEQEEIYQIYQQQFGKSYAKKYVAGKDKSEHLTGLAIDIGILEDGKIYEELEDIIQLQDQLDVIFSHLEAYGFLLRYPKDKEEITEISYEPWHYRYVGKQLAKTLTEENLTLEEYFAKKE